MAGVQVAGLVSGINWQTIVNELIQADSASEDVVKAQQTNVNDQISALNDIGTDLTNLENSVLALQDPSLFSNVTASSTTSGSTWTVNAENNTAPGSYTIDVGRLATSTVLQGADGISAPLNSSSDVSGLTIANLATAQPVTAGTFTVDGQQISVTTSESLQDVFTAIATATGGSVTAAYNGPSADTVTLSGSSPITLGSAADTSNFLQVMQLETPTDDGDTATSNNPLGALQLNNTIADSNLKTAVTAVDGSGNGSFVINGVTIDYNINTDSLNTVLGRIDNSGAGVTATYDPASNQVVLANNVTGNLAINVSESSGGLLGALGLTSGTTTVNGLNAQYSVDGGATQESTSNNLTASALGIPGLNVTATTTGTQTIQVAVDTAQVENAIDTFIASFNTLQTDISNDTTISVNNDGTVSTSILSSNHDVSDWAESLQMSAFGAGTGLSGAINSLDSLGIDFDGTTGQLTISDSAALQQALTNNTSQVAAFFQTGVTGFASVMGTAVTDIIGENNSEQSSLQSESDDLGTQITSMQTQLAAEQNQLETEFEAMESSLEEMQSEESALTSSLGASAGTSIANIGSSSISAASQEANANSSSSSSSSSSDSTSSTDSSSSD